MLTNSKVLLASLLSLCVAMLSNGVRAQTTCVGGGAGGPIPTGGSGDGIWPSTLPSAPLVRTLTTATPAGATALKSIKLNGLSHTYVGDLQFVLQNPSGAKFNVLHRLGHTSTVPGGCSTNLGGSYELVDSVASSPCAGAPVMSCAGSSIAPGTYRQSFGTWPQSNGIVNLGLESIPVPTDASPHTWTLYVYDWAAGDIGTLTSWELCFGTPTPPPPPCCVSGGTGGAIPASGSGDGAWPGTLPSAPMVGTLTTVVPAGASVIRSVKLRGLTHTWIGDLHFVLEAPGGNRYTLLHRLGSAGGSVGCADDWNGDYELTDPIAATRCTGEVPLACVGGTLAPDTYLQQFGDWPPAAGVGSVNNIRLEAIPVPTDSMPHTWKLYVYDWASGDIGALTSWELCFGAPTEPLFDATHVCMGTGAGGVVPMASSVGAWPNSLPAGSSQPFVSPLAVTPPSGATRIAGVKLRGWRSSFAWVGEGQIVLEDPSGTRHNVLQLSDGDQCGGDEVWCAFGDYEFVDATSGVDACGAFAPQLTDRSKLGSGVPPGTYRQQFGAWPSGAAGIHNTSLAAIPINFAPGSVWKLVVYCWCDYLPGSEGFRLDGWELCFDSPTNLSNYCTGGTTSHGCVATMSATNNPSVSFAHACNVTASNVEGAKNGLIFYGINGASVNPWGLGSNSFLCVKAPTQRTAVQSSGGTVNQCDGTLALDWNAYHSTHPTALGAPWIFGERAWLQAWFRDPPAPKSTNLSDALVMTYVP